MTKAKYPKAQATVNKTPAFRGGKMTAYQDKELITFVAKKISPADLARLNLPRDTLIYRWSSTQFYAGTHADVVKSRASSAEYYVNNKERIHAVGARYLQARGFASSWALHLHNNPDAPKRGPRPTAAILQQPAFAALVAASAAGYMTDDATASQLVSIVGLVCVDEYEHSEATPWARTQHMDLHTLMTIISDIESSGRTAA